MNRKKKGMEGLPSCCESLLGIRRAGAGRGGGGSRGRRRGGRGFGGRLVVDLVAIGSARAPGGLVETGGEGGGARGGIYLEARRAVVAGPHPGRPVHRLAQ